MLKNRTVWLRFTGRCKSLRRKESVFLLISPLGWRLGSEIRVRHDAAPLEQRGDRGSPAEAAQQRQPRRGSFLIPNSNQLQKGYTSQSPLTPQRSKVLYFTTIVPKCSLPRHPFTCKIFLLIII